MPEMVEWVQLAIFKARLHPDDAADAELVNQKREEWPQDWEVAGVTARAAIEALRNPSEAMLVAIQDATVCVPGDVYMADAQGDYVWQCGIAAALGAPAEPKSGRLIKPARMPEGGTKAEIDAALEAK